MKKNLKKEIADQGFTMIELLVGMVIAGIVTMAAYSVYVVQQEHYTAQTQVTEIQQSLRAVLDLMTNDIRMAGFDGDGLGDASVAQITAAKPDLFAFTVDYDESGVIDQPGEHIYYDLYDSAGKSTLGRRLDNDNALLTLNESPVGHFEVPNHQPVAENVEQLEFHYLADNDDSLGTSVSNTKLDEIAAVQISILVKADLEDQKFDNIMTYTTASGVNWVKNDHFRRRFQIMTVECRNANL